MNVIEFESTQGKILVEIDTNKSQISSGRTDVSILNDQLIKTGKNIEELLSTFINSIISSSYNVFVENSDNKPNEMEMKFGIKFSIEGNIYLAKSSNETNFEVTLKWKKD